MSEHQVPEFNSTWRQLGLDPIKDSDQVHIYNANCDLLLIYNIVADTRTDDGPEVDILKALWHNQIKLETAIDVLGGIKWDRNNTKEKEKNV